MAQTEVEIQRQKEMQQAEELLFSGRQELGFAKGLFLGNFVADWVMPYPRLDATRQTELNSALNEVRQMLDHDLDPDWIDRNADIPRNLIDGLARTGVLGMTIVLNVAGPRASQWPEGHKTAQQIVSGILRRLVDRTTPLNTVRHSARGDP